MLFDKALYVTSYEQVLHFKQVFETAKLLDVIEGEENIEKMDGLLSLAFTGGDYNWL